MSKKHTEILIISLIVALIVSVAVTYASNNIRSVRRIIG